MNGSDMMSRSCCECDINLDRNFEAIVDELQQLRGTRRKIELPAAQVIVRSVYLRTSTTRLLDSLRTEHEAVLLTSLV